MYSIDTLDKSMTHIPGGIDQDSGRFHDNTQNSMQFKTCELFICGIFHLILLDNDWLWVTETLESKATNREELL